MAGLIDYVTMGFGVAALYIGVKFGPQIIQNVQAGSKAPAQATAPAQQPATTVSPIQTDEGGAPISTTPRTGPHRYRPTVLPAHDWHPQSTQAPPSGSVHEKPSTQPSRARMHPKSVTQEPGNIPNEHCACIDGKQNGTACNVRGQPCATTTLSPQERHLLEVSKGYEAYPGYYNSYNIPTEGPGWKQSIPYNQVVASQGMVQGRVRRALAATNHNFMPAGFVLSESSVRRGVNNVYSAGT